MGGLMAVAVLLGVAVYFEIRAISKRLGDIDDRIRIVCTVLQERTEPLCMCSFRFQMKVVQVLAECWRNYYNTARPAFVACVRVNFRVADKPEVEWANLAPRPNFWLAGYNSDHAAPKTFPEAF